MNAIQAPDGQLKEDEDDDADFNPLDFFDELKDGDVETDDRGRKIEISKQEAKDLQNDMFDNFFSTEATINLDNNTDSQDNIQELVKYFS